MNAIDTATLVQGTYCGLPPPPEALLSAWNGDARLHIAMAALALMGLWSANRRVFAAAWLAAVVAFVSPLCALTVSLLAARSFHHVWLLTLVAPLWGWALPQLRHALRAHHALSLAVAALLLWHVPKVYSWAWNSEAVYWTLQLALWVPAAIWWAHLWQAHTYGVRYGSAVPARGVMREARSGWSCLPVVTALSQIAVATAVMGFLGAILTFAPQALYLEHAASTWAYGLTPLEDQQLAGLLMWVPGFLPMAGMAAWMLRRMWRNAARVSKAVPT